MKVLIERLFGATRLSNELEAKTNEPYLNVGGLETFARMICKSPLVKEKMEESGTPIGEGDLPKV